MVLHEAFKVGASTPTRDLESLENHCRRASAPVAITDGSMRDSGIPHFALPRLSSGPRRPWVSLRAITAYPINQWGPCDHGLYKHESAVFHGGHGLSFARGTSVSIEFDENNFTGGGVYLFASVIERFLGLYSSLNSFSRLVATTQQRSGVLRAWPPRSGTKPLL